MHIQSSYFMPYSARSVHTGHWPGSTKRTSYRKAPQSSGFAALRWTKHTLTVFLWITILTLHLQNKRSTLHNIKMPIFFFSLLKPWAGRWSGFFGHSEGEQRGPGSSSQRDANCCLAIRRRCAESRLRAQVGWLWLHSYQQRGIWEKQHKAAVRESQIVP